ncbi:hypothetical protein GCM10027299_05250 [Larkinella ripae]
MIDTIRQKIQEAFVRYDHRVPADVINRLFATIPSDETTLTQEIMGYLLENNYEALRTPQGETQRDRLISTDWQQKEIKTWLTTPETLAMPVSADVSLHPIATPFSQSNKVLIALVMLFVTILLWLWKGKLSAIDNVTSRDDSTETEQTVSGNPQPAKPVESQSVGAVLKQKAETFPIAGAPAAKNNNNLTAPVAVMGQSMTKEDPASESSAIAETVKPYDAVDNQVGDFGLRAARKGGKWGYVDQKDQWQINPVFDDVMPFQDGKALVILDGQQISIDRDGARIRDEN